MCSCSRSGPFTSLQWQDSIGFVERSRNSRPYEVPGYPIVPAVFIAAGLYLVGNAFVADPLLTSVPFAIIVAGIPVYYFAFRNSIRSA